MAKNKKQNQTGRPSTSKETHITMKGLVIMLNYIFFNWKQLITDLSNSIFQNMNYNENLKID